MLEYVQQLADFIRYPFGVGQVAYRVEADIF